MRIFYLLGNILFLIAAEKNETIFQGRQKQQEAFVKDGPVELTSTRAKGCVIFIVI